MEWYYQGKVFTEDMIADNVGFVYEITNLTNGKKYIGKKNFTQVRKRVSKKKKRPVRVTKNSDWQVYTGSSRSLQEDIKVLGEVNFKKEIIKLCKTKGEMSYYEIKAQLDNDVLLCDDYYNDYVGCRINRSHLKGK
jgi:hypothetical protein